MLEKHINETNHRVNLIIKLQKTFDRLLQEKFFLDNIYYNLSELSEYVSHLMELLNYATMHVYPIEFLSVNQRQSLFAMLKSLYSEQQINSLYSITNFAQLAKFKCIAQNNQFIFAIVIPNFRKTNVPRLTIS